MDSTSIWSTQTNFKLMHLIKFQIPSVTLEEPAGEIGQAMSDKAVRNALIENIFVRARESHTNVCEQLFKNIDQIIFSSNWTQKHKLPTQYSIPGSVVPLAKFRFVMVYRDNKAPLSSGAYFWDTYPELSCQTGSQPAAYRRRRNF